MLEVSLFNIDISIEDDKRTITMVEPDFDDEPVLTALETEVHVPPLTDREQAPENPQPQFDNALSPHGHYQETTAEGNTSTRAEDNKDEILNLLQISFSDLKSPFYFFTQGYE